MLLTIEGLPGHAKPALVATEEVFDSDTGKTVVTVNFEDCACGVQ